MALDSVGARVEGDVFQGLFFWREAARLLIDGSAVVRVDLEHDEADGVDDVAVFYTPPGVEAGGFLATADYYQLKYHVDQRSEYSSEAIIDPDFIGAKRSLLQRFHGAYQRIRPEHAGFRLHLASNWRWGDDDPLGKSLREFDGALPEQFFSSSTNSRVGRIRERWRQHLRVSPNDFDTFSRCLRFQTDHFGRRFFREGVHDRLARAGLRLPPDNRASSPYESLVQRFLIDKRASFGRDEFRRLCELEGLIANARAESRRSRTIGVRSFLRFAEDLDDDAGTVVSVVDKFSGRHPADATSWPAAAFAVEQGLSSSSLHKQLRANEHEVMLECHGSLALLAGYQLSRNSGALVYPVQKPGRVVWKPGAPYVGPLWTRDELALDPAAHDVVVTLSITHDVRRDVDAYVRAAGIDAVARIDLSPAKGPGPAAVEGADHAATLAAAVVDEMQRARPARTAVVHLFAAVPNSILFFLGQHREALGRMQIYEFDFSLERDGSYAASIAIPLKTLEN